MTFYFPKFNPQNTFPGQIWSQGLAFCFNDTRYIVLFRDADSEFGTLKFSPNVPFLGKFGPKKVKYFALNDSLCIEVFRGADSEFENYYFKFRPQNAFFGRTLKKEG